MPDARVSNTITGRDAFLRVLSDEGVTKMFGNPGTTELPIMHALSSAPEMGYVLGLQEAVVICMADGAPRASSCRATSTWRPASATPSARSTPR